MDDLAINVQSLSDRPTDQSPPDDLRLPRAFFLRLSHSLSPGRQGASVVPPSDQTAPITTCVSTLAFLPMGRTRAAPGADTLRFARHRQNIKPENIGGVPTVDEQESKTIAGPQIQEMAATKFKVGRPTRHPQPTRSKQLRNLHGRGETGVSSGRLLVDPGPMAIRRGLH